MKRTCSLAALILAAALSLTGCQCQKKIAIGAHRGFWRCDEAAQAQNSIASFRVAQDNGFWGSEFDVNMTADDQLIVVHGPAIQDVEDVRALPLDSLAHIKLPNGEGIPTLAAYIDQAAASPCMMVLEIKPHDSPERDAFVTRAIIDLLKEKGRFDPKQVMFISFSYDVCRYIAENAPEFTNQYLEGDKSPAELHADGINGLDYYYEVFREHPEWVAEAHKLGMSVNVWTVDEAEVMQEMIDAGVDCITTNEPLLCRELLGSRERRP